MTAPTRYRYPRPLVTIAVIAMMASVADAESRPNILLCISDDQSYAHTGAAGDPVVKTPAFDRIAREGIFFTHAFCDAPSCGPSRSALLTGQPIWRLEEAGNIHSTLPAKFTTYTEMLSDAGYAIGYTGKGWSPGRLEPGGRTTNPAGQEYSAQRQGKPTPGIANKDYAGSFGKFLSQVPEDQPFCFWLGTHEPHRGFKRGAGADAGEDASRVIVPPCLPDHQVVRNDLLDYYMEVEHFDHEVGRAIELLEQAGRADNTLVVVTSDHGMPFPRAKASLYDEGSRVPLAIRWPKGIEAAGRTSQAFVNLSDLAPTFVQAAGLEPDAQMTAHSLLGLMKRSAAEAGNRDRAFIAMERHDGCRRGGKGYPCRAIRTKQFLYIINHEPQRWPAGDPDASVCARAIPFGEVDSSPTKQLLLDQVSDRALKPFYDLAFAKRPAEELYDLASDPGQIRNVADDPQFAKAKARLRLDLIEHLIATKDPREIGGEANWDYYPYYGLRRNKDWTVDPKP